MGVSKEYHKDVQLTKKTEQLIHKAGLKKSAELETALRKACNNGEYPILCDMSPCLYTMKENIDTTMKMYEPAEFILKYLVPELKITPIDETISVFPVCSIKKMGLEDSLIDLAKLCATRVIVPESNCCGFAGDKGFTFPELNKHGLRNLKVQLPLEVRNGYSTSRTCEIGLSLHSQISYKSIIYIVDQVSKPKKANQTFFFLNHFSRYSNSHSIHSSPKTTC